MPKKPCQHGSLLPRGLVCDRGFLAIRLKTPEGNFFKGCGPHTKDMEVIAIIGLNDVRKSQYLKVFKLPQKERRLLFKEAALYYFKKHFIEFRHPTKGTPRSAGSIMRTKQLINSLIKDFGKRHLDDLSVAQLKAYKDDMLAAGSSGSTFNRRKAVLSSLYSMYKQWVKEGTLKHVVLPQDNPCDFVPDLEETSRSRVATMDELRQLKKVCFELNDMGLWTIIQSELETTLRKADLKKLGATEVRDGRIIIKQGKTGNDVVLPASVKPLQGQIWTNLRERWETARTKAQLEDLQFRDLRRTGAHMLKAMNYSDELIKDTLGHTSAKTTKLYLNYKDLSTIAPMIESRRKLLDGL